MKDCNTVHTIRALSSLFKWMIQLKYGERVIWRNYNTMYIIMCIYMQSKTQQFVRWYQYVICKHYVIYNTLQYIT